jgi:predicted CXXCH cytochrome family protein
MEKDSSFIPLLIDKADQDSLTDKTFFAATIQPILQAKCYSCHNEHKLKGGLDMSSIEKLLKGGEDGPICIPWQCRAKFNDSEYSLAIG